MASREEILADFQACTGIEDVEIAICQLEAADWNLMDAVNKALASGGVGGGVADTGGGVAVEPDVVEVMDTAEAADDPGQPVPAALPPPPPPMMLPMPTDRRPPSPPIRVDSAIQPPLIGPLLPPVAAVAAAALYGMPSGTGGLSLADDFFAGPSSARTRLLEFTIQHHDRLIHLKVPDNEDVKTLKTLIQNETGFPPCQQDLRGFKGSSGLPASDRRRLADLNLPKENVLYLLTPEIPAEHTNGETQPPQAAAADDEQESSGDFSLTVVDESHDKTYSLNFRPTTSVLNVKLDVVSVTSIPVSKQRWRGWPEQIDDGLSLAQIGIPRQHTLHLSQDLPPAAAAAAAAAAAERSMPVLVDTVAAAAPSTAASSTAASSTAAAPTHDSDSDDFEDAPEDMLGDDDLYFAPESGVGVGGSGVGGGGAAAGSLLGSSRVQPLLPDDYGDETLAAIKFAEEFAGRYGAPRPEFFQGKLEEAIRESCLQPARERKMLAVYLHHDSSVLSNVFCTQVLCADSMVAFLNANFVTFGWDLTYPSNRQRATDMIAKEFGNVAAQTVKNIDVERLPMLALIYRLRGTTEIFQIIHGNVALDELMSRLLSAQETYGAQLALEVREEDEREARDAVKREQDLAFEMAQFADREKEAARRREEAEKEEQEKLEEAIRASEEEHRRAEDRERERQRTEIRRRLPDEPAEDAPDVAKLRFRVSGGAPLERRFLGSDDLRLVLDFLASKGFPHEDFKVLSSWPRRDLTQLDDKSATLKELKLFPQETLTLEEK